VSLCQLALYQPHSSQCTYARLSRIPTWTLLTWRTTAVSACGVVVAGEAGRSAAALLVVSQQAAAQLAICLWSLQVHWDCHLGHFVNVRYWWHSCSNSARFIRGFRHRRPDHSAATSAYFVWSERRCLVMVPFDHLTPASTACVSLRQAVSAVYCSVRHTTRVRTGPAPLHDVHSWHCQHRRVPGSLRRQ